MTDKLRKLTRAEMIELVERIRRAEGTEEEISAAVQLFVDNCLHPDGSGPIFWPHGFPHNPNLPEPTRRRMSIRPFLLAQSFGSNEVSACVGEVM
jgi:Colicin immunity protein / pyocin immunity protein